MAGTAMIFVTSSQFSALEMTLDSRDAQKQGNKASCLSLGAYGHIWHILCEVLSNNSIFLYVTTLFVI